LFAVLKNLILFKQTCTDAKTLAEPPLITKLQQTLMASGTGLAKPSSSRMLGITGGSDAALGQFPHAVALKMYSSDYIWRCAGALFAQNLVITTGKLFYKLIT
jgi:hypothetical protein